MLSQRLTGARRRIDIGIYEMSVYYAWILRNAAVSGVRVRLLLDHHAGANAGTAAMLHDDGKCRALPGKFGAHAHWKTLRIDESIAVGTGNLLHRDAPRDRDGVIPPAHVSAGPGTREWWVFIDGNASLRAGFASAFANWWARGITPPRSWGATTPLSAVPPVGVPLPLIAPATFELFHSAVDLVLGGSGAGDLLIREFGAATGRIYVTVPYVHQRVAVVRELIALMGDAARRGADVRLLLGAPAEGIDPSAFTDAGVPVRVMDPSRSTTGHAKGIIVDDVAMIMSSNWSRSGLGSNLEACLRVADSRVAQYFGVAFTHDWATARVVSRPEGNAPPPP